MRLLLLQPILLGDDTQVRPLTREALSDRELENISRRASQSRERSPPGSVVSYVWLYMGLDGMAPYTIFNWSRTREEAWIDTPLANFHGVFVGDAAWINARLGQCSGGRIAPAACNTHARRELVAAEKNHPREAAKALAFYKRLDAIEAPCKLLPEPKRLAFRRRESLPIWNGFRQWINSDAMRGILPKTRLGKALTYFNNHWEALRLYLHD